MELVNEFVNNQFALYIPVALVLVGAILVFAFGFKSAEQPPFDKLSSINSEERKALGKKKKMKEKKLAVNGSIINVHESKVEKSPSKETKRKESLENRKTESIIKSISDKKKNESAKNKTLEDKNKKNIKAKINEKPLDFDDGNWETVPTKGEKKKKQDSPIKKERKNKKSEKYLEIDKLVKDVVNKELQEKDKTESLAIGIKEIENKEVEAVKIELIEIKKEKKTEKKNKKSDIERTENIETEKMEIITSSPVKVEQPFAKIPNENVAFDELGDVWKEAKQPKKNKKKSRRDN